jgi:hypothetical protein
VQRACDKERASRSLHNAHFLMLSQQLRDSHATMETLRSRVTELQSQVHVANAARDCAELKLEFVEMAQARKSTGVRHRTRFSPRPAKVKRKSKEVAHYPEGGGHVYFFTDESADESVNSDSSNKENVMPSVSHAITPVKPGHPSSTIPPPPSQPRRVFSTPTYQDREHSSPSKAAASTLLSLSSSSQSSNLSNLSTKAVKSSQ